MSISFMHIADIHLDSPFKNIHHITFDLVEQIKQSQKQSLAALCQIAIEKKVDFFIIAGDSFDRVNASVSSQLYFKSQLQQLIDANIQVILCYGNHDYMDQTVLVPLQDEIAIFSKEVDTFYFQTKKGETVAFSGFSYDKKHDSARRIQSFPQRSQVDFHIGVLHGELDYTQKSRYAPYSLPELNEKGYDYWALGHIHKRQVLQAFPPIVYPGNIQGLNRKETGEKGGYHVVLSKETAPILTFIPTAFIQWTHQTVTIDGKTTIEYLIDKIHNMQTSVFNFMTIEWHIQETVNRHLLEWLSEKETALLLSTPMVRVIRTSLHFDRPPLKVLLDETMQESLFDYLQQGVSTQNYQEVMADLFYHPSILKYLPNLYADSDLQMDILDRARQLIQEKMEGIV